MSANPVPLSTKDLASGQLSAGISANSVSIPLQTGQGANFPQPYSGTCTSVGTSTTLNATGISAIIGGSAAVGKFIQNYTDGSIAVITAVSTNSLTTTALLGGTSNTWGNGQAWRIDPFVLTIEHHDSATPYNVTAREEVLVSGRSTDTLTVASSSERGYNGTTAQTWLASDYVYLHVTSPIVERFKDLVSVLAQQLDTNTTSASNLNKGAPFYAADTGAADAYAVTLSPAPTAYTAGMIVNFVAANSNTTTSTLNVNGLGVKTIKKQNGATNLVAGDVIAGQYLTCEYDGTNFQMTSPPASILSLTSLGFFGDGNDGTVTWSSSTNLNPSTEKRYTTATLNSSQTLSVSSVNTPLVIHNSGNVTINGTVDMNGQGGPAGSGGTGVNANGGNGTAGNSLVSGWTVGAGNGGTGGTNGGGGGGSGASVFTNGSSGTSGNSGAAGTGGTAISVIQMAFLGNIFRGVCCGGGGGGGGANTSGSSINGAGGAGGGALVWMIGGNLTLGASSIIRANGAAGSNSSGAGGSGGAGGGGGTILILVAGTITNSGLTLSASGGSGGTGQGGAGGGGNGATGANGKAIIYSLSTGTLITA